MKMLITDDHPVVRRGMREIIADHYENCQIDEASTGWQALEMAQNGDYDLLLLDISLPDISGIEVLRKLKDRKLSPPVLMMSFLPEEHYAIRALKAGASGYLAKASASEELVNSMQKVLEGGKYMSATLGERLVSSLQSR